MVNFKEQSPPTSPPPNSSTSSTWRPISSVKMNDLYTVSKYRCSETGMDLVHARVDGPNVHCYWIIPHQLDSNSGIPHVLQHTIWRGSKRFPFSGCFERISSKCFSAEPKAWAEKDHCCYQITTAGKAGFSALLPVVFDHIFNPLLQEASFITEVFHVEGDGTDQGHCLEESLKSERDPEDVCTFELLRMCFGPESHYSYNYEGTSDAFRAGECTLEKVREFHEKFYHSRNCCLVVVGDLVRDDLFQTLAPIITRLAKDERTKWTSLAAARQRQARPSEWEAELSGEDGDEEDEEGSHLDSAPQAEGWTKPWLKEPLVTVTEARMRRVEYPFPIPHQKFTPRVKVGIVGPPSTEKLNRCVAMKLLLQYLLSGPLHQNLTTHRTRGSTMLTANYHGYEIQLATSVSVNEYELKQTVFSVEFHDVPLEMISAAPLLLRRAMDGLLTGDEFDLDTMHEIVTRLYQDELDGVENFPHDKILHAVIPDYLYSDSDSDLMFDRRINSAYTIHHFLSQDVDFWKHVIKVCFLDHHWVTIGAVPSRHLYDKLLLEDQLRVETRMNDENIKDTKKWAQRFKAATKMVSRPPPAELWEKFSLPSVNTISYIRISRQDNPSWAKDTLCNLYVDDINSNYVFLTIIMDTSELTLDERKHLVLFSEGLLNSPYIDNADVFHTAEEMQTEIAKDVVNYETFFGLEWRGNLEDRSRFMCGSYPHLFCMRLELEVAKVKEGFHWAQLLLWSTKWQADKLKEVATKLYKEIELELKNDGPTMTRAMLVDSLYLLNSTPKCVSLVRQKLFLRKIAEELPKSMRRVSKYLEQIRMTILRPENVTVHVAASLPRMEFHLTEDPNARDAIANLLRRTFDYTGWHWGYDTKRLSNTPDMFWMRSQDCIAKCSREQILRMENTDVGYLIQAAPGVRSYHDPDYPFLLIALQYFIQSPDGPLHTQVVESGLAEQVDIRVTPSEGILVFEMRACPDLAAAYAKTFDVIAKHLGEATNNNVKGEEGEDPWEEHIFVAAKSSIVFRLTQEENTPTHVAMCSLLAYYKGLNLHDTRTLMEHISNASMQQVQDIAKKYFKPLFLQPCTCAASAPVEKAIPTIKELMERCGKRLALIPPVEQSSLASFNT